MNLTTYLQRLDYHGPLDVTPDVLRDLQIAHLQHIPFENLDIHLQRPIVLDLDKLFDKIVRCKRGGFCYELNGVFAALLKTLGFEVTLLSARDVHDNGTFGLEFDHLTLMVECPRTGDGTRWLADVGWGDSFVEPLRIDDVDEQPQGLRAYRIEQADGYRVMWQRNYAGTWERQYSFTLRPRRFGEFAGMCVYHQTSPDSIFTRKRIVTMAAPDGRVSLDNTRFIMTTGGIRRERQVESEDEWRWLLREHFAIEL